MKRFINWTKKPITWGGLFKFGFISFILSTLMTVLTVFAPMIGKKFKDRKMKNEK